MVAPPLRSKPRPFDVMWESGRGLDSTALATPTWFLTPPQGPLKPDLHLQYMYVHVK